MEENPFSKIEVAKIKKKFEKFPIYMLNKSDGPDKIGTFESAVLSRLRRRTIYI